MQSLEMDRAIKCYHLSARSCKLFLIISSRLFLLGCTGKNFSENFSSSLFCSPCFSLTKVRPLPSLFRHAWGFYLCMCCVRGIASSRVSAEKLCAMTSSAPRCQWNPHDVILTAAFSFKDKLVLKPCWFCVIGLGFLDIFLSHLIPQYTYGLNG